MLGFEVYDRETLDRMLDKYAYTDNGKLLKQDSHGNWEEVKERGEYQIIPYNHDGKGEIY